MPDDQYSSQPFDPSEKIYPKQTYPSGQPSYPPMQQPYPPGQPSYPMGQSYPPGQPMYPGQQPYYPPPQPQPYYPPQQANPNQIAIVVNNSQQVNNGGGCAPWFIWTCVGIGVLLLCSFLAVPVLIGTIGVVSTSSVHNAASSMNGDDTSKNSSHHTVGETVTVIEEGQKCTMVVNSLQVKKDASSGDTYLVANLSATNTGNTKISPNFLQFSLIDANNHTAKPEELDSAEAQQFFGSEVQPGGKTSGELVFEIQPDQHTFTMTYLTDDLTTYGWDLHV